MASRNCAAARSRARQLNRRTGSITPSVNEFPGTIFWFTASKRKEPDVRLLKLKTVLVATDLEPSSDRALETGASLAAAAGATLHVAHVTAAEKTNAENRGSSSAARERMDATLRRAGISVQVDNVHIAAGAPVEVLSSLSDQITADVIVIGRHRQRTDMDAHSAIGSTAYTLITRSLRPCLITSRRLRLPLRRAMVAIDTSETARGALLVALSWSSALRDSKAEDAKTTLTALHIETSADLSADDIQMRRNIDHELDILRRNAGSWAGVAVKGTTEAGSDPAKAIMKYATEHDAELVVLGTRGLSADNALRLGSVSTAVARGLSVPVLLVPPAIWRNYARDIDYF
jgi:nucleotide-binding universal stress UspA family protein